MIDIVVLHPTLNPISAAERVKINGNWDAITRALSNIQNQINFLAGGEEVDLIIGRINEAIVNADTRVQEAVNAVNESLGDLDIAINNAELATSTTIDARNLALTATTDARTAIAEISTFINDFKPLGAWNDVAEYKKNNLVTFDGGTYIALKDNSGTPISDGTAWALFAERGIQGEKGETGEIGPTGLTGEQGPIGLTGLTGDQGAGLNIIGELADESELPPIGSTGDNYLIGGDLYTWTGSNWTNAGSIKGPAGDSGIIQSAIQPTGVEEGRLWLDTGSDDYQGTLLEGYPEFKESVTTQLAETAKKANTESSLLFSGIPNDISQAQENSNRLLNLIKQNKKIVCAKNEYYFTPIPLPTNLAQIEIEGNGSIFKTNGGDLFTSTSAYKVFCYNIEFLSSNQLGKCFYSTSSMIFQMIGCKIQLFENAIYVAGDSSTSNFINTHINKNYYGLLLLSTCFFTNIIDCKIQRNVVGVRIPKGFITKISGVNVFPAYNGRDSGSVQEVICFDLGSGIILDRVWIEEYGLDTSNVTQYKINYIDYDASPIVIDVGSCRFMNEIAIFTVNDVRSAGTSNFPKDVLFLNNVTEIVIKSMVIKTDNQRMVRGIIINNKNYVYGDNFSIFNKTEYHINAQEVMKTPNISVGSALTIPLGYSAESIENYTKIPMYNTVNSDQLYSTYQNTIVRFDGGIYKVDYRIEANGSTDGAYDMAILFRKPDLTYALKSIGTFTVIGGKGLLSGTTQLEKCVLIHVVFVNTKALPATADFPLFKLEAHYVPVV